MSTALDFFVPCVPPKAGSQKVVLRYGNRNIVSKTKAGMAAEDVVRAARRPSAGDAVSGPVALTIELTWPWRKGEKKTVVKTGRAFHTTRPDLDNLSKTITDCLVRSLFMADDAQVAELVMRKFWGDKPGVRVVIRTIEVQP